MSHEHACPWWLAYTFDHPGRRLLQKPERILAPYVSAGMTVLDIGCGMGFFSIAMARMVGDRGRVISVDLQTRMFSVLMKRAERKGIADRIEPVCCAANRFGVTEEVDFVLAFYVIHEIPDKGRAFGEIREVLKPKARFLLAEPAFHVSRGQYQQILDEAQTAGMRVCGEPQIRLSHAALLGL